MPTRGKVFLEGKDMIFGVLSIILLAQAASAASNYLVTESAPVYPGDTTYVYVPIKNMGFCSFRISM